MRKLASGTFIVLFFLTAIAGVHYGLYRLLAGSGTLSVKEIDVKGAPADMVAEIISASGVEKGMDVMSLPLREIAGAVMDKTPVSSVTVSRDLPDRVIIEVKMREPAAFLSDGTNTVLYDREGCAMKQNGIVVVPVLLIETPVDTNADRLDNEALRVVLRALADLSDRSKVRTVALKEKEGFYVTLRGMDGTLFFLGKSVPDNDTMARVNAVADKIRTQKLNVNYIDINRDNAVGYQK
jgi:cell division septal protein FtsQ